MKSLIVASLASLFLFIPSPVQRGGESSPLKHVAVGLAQPIQTPTFTSVEALETAQSALQPLGTYANDYVWGNCTAYVASRLPVPNSMGNANNWAYEAALLGYTVSNAPEVGAIAQTGGDSSMGHVAIVEALNPDGTFVVSEMNYAGLGVVDSRTTSTVEFPNFIII